jgi:hypothetical protein
LGAGRECDTYCARGNFKKSTSIFPHDDLLDCPSWCACGQKTIMTAKLQTAYAQRVTEI